jgi:hypothetical protein
VEGRHERATYKVYIVTKAETDEGIAGKRVRGFSSNYQAKQPVHCTHFSLLW